MIATNFDTNFLLIIFVTSTSLFNGISALETTPVPIRTNLTEEQLVLESESTPGWGNVLIYKHGTLWSICDDEWNLNSAKVACISLGYRGASRYTTNSFFGITAHDIGLDNVKCNGNEPNLMVCRHLEFKTHNCNKREAAGVKCIISNTTPSYSNYNIFILSLTKKNKTTRKKINTKRNTHFTRFKKKSSQLSFRTTKLYFNLSNAETVYKLRNETELNLVDEFNLQHDQIIDHLKAASPNFLGNEIFEEIQKLKHLKSEHFNHYPQLYEIRLRGGKNINEGRIEILIEEKWGVICSDHWTLIEGTVICKQLGLGFAQHVYQGSFYGGTNLTKMAVGMKCDGDEQKLNQCYHGNFGGHGVTCSNENMVAGVVCRLHLPDLVPNATLIQKTAYLQDLTMYHMICAMEENCAAPSAFVIKKNKYDWEVHTRRLLRFSSSIWNFGTAEFRPHLRKEDWEWHLCHMHYHSMQVFASYDLLDHNGNKVAEGHKASFCLEDVQCVKGVTKKFSCKGFEDQGISVGCADDYLHDIDCQWVDITDVKIGHYTFKIHVNPDMKIGELDFNNNAVRCNLHYTGSEARVTNCTLGKG